MSLEEESTPDDCNCTLGVIVRFSDLEILTVGNINKHLNDFHAYQRRLFTKRRMREFDSRALCVSSRSRLEKDGWWCFDYCPDCGRKIDWSKL